jgi:hypothetical protein
VSSERLEADILAHGVPVERRLITGIGQEEFAVAELHGVGVGRSP